MQKTYLPTVPQAWLCTLALCLVVLLAACGGDTGATTPAGTSANAPGSTATSASTTTNTTPGAPPSGAPASVPTSAAPTIAQNIAIVGFAFGPKTLTVKVGTKVNWTNDDPSIHTVTADNNAFNSPSLPPGAKFSFTFTKAGTYSYHCKFHATMKATIVVQ